MRSAIVLGAGMVGVSTALELRRRGWSVALVDRRAPGRETSYGNAGFIQSEAVRPYAMPRGFASLLRIALGRSNEVHYRLASLPWHLLPLLRYYRHSAPRRHERSASAYAALILRATAAHDALIREAGAGNLVARGGYRDLHRDPLTLEQAVRQAEQLRAEHGRQFQVLSPAELTRAEPALRFAGVGAIHWQDPLTISDPGALVAAYAELFLRRGGMITLGDATTLHAHNSGWSVATVDGTVGAETAVVALGPWSPELLRNFGYRFPMVDESYGYALAPMAQGLRITTGAELAGTEPSENPPQLRRAEAAARELIDLGRAVEAVPWSGVRPCMPDMLPVIGAATRHAGLWLNFGHGHQGFTLGPASGSLLAQMMSGEMPDVDADPYSPARF